MSKTAVIIVAGGSGQRMGSEIPKQFIKINGKEILVRCVERFLEAVPESRIIVVLPESETERWNDIAAKHNLTGTHTVCKGGANRFESVKSGLAKADGADYIAVHDGVRPFPSANMIRKCLKEAVDHGTAIPVVEPVDSFRILKGERTEIIDRSLLRAVQTPQVFRADILQQAYDTGYMPHFTDDASVAEYNGAVLNFCEGEYQNIKITTRTDLILAEAIAAAQDMINS